MLGGGGGGGDPLGSLLADEAWADEFHTCLRATTPAPGWHRLIAFYPIIECEGPADVWDHQCQHLIKTVAVQKMIIKDEKKDCLNVHYIFLFVTTWCNVSKDTGACWLADATGTNVLFFPAEPLMKLTDLRFCSEWVERACRRLRDGAWQESFPVEVK